MRGDRSSGRLRHRRLLAQVKVDLVQDYAVAHVVLIGQPRDSERSPSVLRDSFQLASLATGTYSSPGAARTSRSNKSRTTQLPTLYSSDSPTTVVAPPSPRISVLV